MALCLPSEVVLDEAWPDEPEVRSVLDAIVADLRDDPHAMVSAVLDGMRREVPSYAAMGEDDARVVAQGVVHTVTTFIGLLAAQRRLTPEEVDGIAAIGRVRASQGVPAEEMLTAVRVALRWGWAHLLDRAAALPVTEATPAVLGRLGAEAFEYMQQAAAAMARGAQEHQRNGLVAQAWAQRELFEEVLSGAFSTDDDIVRLGAALDIDLAQPFAVVLVAGDDRDALRRVRDLVVGGVPGALDGSLRADPMLHGVVVVPVLDSGRSVERAVAAAVNEGFLVLASPPALGPSAVRDAYRKAAALLEVALRVGRGPGLVDTAGLAAPRLLASADPVASAAFVADVLGPVLDLPETRRNRLLDALEATLATETLGAAGERLGLHPKTVAARLREVEQHTGLHLDRADERLLFDLALLLRRLHGD